MYDLQDRYDLRLPAWGPYTKDYMGISHLPDVASGIRFDLSVFPGFYRRRVDPPNVMWESGYHPWEAAPDLSYYTHRHELEWRDRVYADISYVAVDEKSRLVRCLLVNNTNSPQSLVLHLVASLHYPLVGRYGSEPIRVSQAVLPPGAIWLDALDYSSLVLAEQHPTDNLVPDGLLRGEVRGHGYVAGSGLGAHFSEHVGDTVTYAIDTASPMQDAVLLLRYRLRGGGSATVDLGGLCDGSLTLAGDWAFRVATTAIGGLEAGRHVLTITCKGDDPFELDGLVLVEAAHLDELRFQPLMPMVIPQILPGPHEKSVVLKYRDAPVHYGLAWDFARFEVREFRSPDLDRFMRYTVHEHTRRVLGESDAGHYTDVFLRPIPLGEREEATVYGLVCSGEHEEVNERIASFDLGASGCEDLYEAARARRAAPALEGPGAAYAIGQERLAATLLTNVVYPVYCRRSYIRHNTPGRWWDSLYTWDSGFIGLGLAELDLERAVDCLNTYVTPPGDPHAAFLHHGSPVPVQIYLFQELWNRTQSRELAEFFYPRLRQYHLFLAGRLGSSTTRSLRSGLLKTWDYFYNSGGWDDYPPQVYVHASNLEDRVTPVINTAQAIRTAKVLALAAEALGLPEHVQEYEREASELGDALLRYAWDESSGYFAYVVHDEEGRPRDILRHESGANYNMGLDGVYPLVAGIGSNEQRRGMIARLSSRSELFSPIGLSAVSQAAPYYRVDGYWNGTVWMAHQWFFWKALLDHGEDHLAWDIARTALELWEREVRLSYNCFEHFVIESGRGAGWHHFGGLSVPVLCWYGAYYRPGKITGGLDVWLEHCDWQGQDAVEASLRRHPASVGLEASVLVTLQPHGNYRVLWEGAEVPWWEVVPGCLSVRLPAGAERGTLVVDGV